MRIIVCPLSQVEALTAERSPSHLLTLLSPGHEIQVATPKSLPADRHLRIGVHDIWEPAPGQTLPQPDMVHAVLAFGRGWSGEAPILVHCWAGISRSSASAFTLACARNPHADEAAIAREIRARSPHAAPNPRIVALADEILGRNGRMVAALAAIGPGEPALENRPFEIAADW